MSHPRGILGAKNMEQSVEEDEGILKVIVDIPGVEKDDIELSVSERGRRKILHLQVSSETDNKSRYYKQSVPLKAPVREDEAEARYNNGVLTVEIPIFTEDSSGTSISID
jgi:HSP20 family protein